MTQRINKEKARGAKLKQMVQLHVSLNTEDQVRRQSVSDYIKSVLHKDLDHKTPEIVSGGIGSSELFIFRLSIQPASSLSAGRYVGRSGREGVRGPSPLRG